MVVGIHQPNFLPWVGFFDKIVKSDVFVLIDDVQFPKGSVANRNKVKNNQGKEVWITVPVRHKDGLMLNYNQLEIDNTQKWNIKIINVLRSAYSKAPYYKVVFPFVEQLLMQPYNSLAHLNITCIKEINNKLEIQTPVYISSELKEEFGEKNDRNLNICSHFNATVYLSGQGAKKYNEEASFKEKGISIVYQKFDHPVYPQPNGPFISHLSVVDALFNLGYDGLSQHLLNKSVGNDVGVV